MNCVVAQSQVWCGLESLPRGSAEAQRGHGFRVEGEDGEDGLVDAPEGFASGESLEGLEAEGVLA